ncbi:ion transporter [Parashewanella curva]|uniref:Ion transporter n=1 Tax=Parashewanella curva TaxID=2338552 RepID=A0A3L8Q2G8_9GAMM|nr:potassium channel family protein [Parashewanella curva]RLV60562.1 ion transporter [Parashewanella curva]
MTQRRRLFDQLDGPKPFELAMMILSLIAVTIMLFLAFGDLSDQTHKLLFFIDTSICLVFLGHFFYCLFRSKHKLQYLKHHWIDFVASIPAIEPLRAARIFQVLRVLRLIRTSRSLLLPLLKQKKEATFASLLVAIVAILSLSSVLILIVESGVDSANIHTAEQAIWWALVTISTVGYGDYYPVTTVGHIIGGLVIISGVSFFGVVSGYMASVFVAPDEDEIKETQREHREQIKFELQQALARMEANQKQMEQNQQLLLNEVKKLSQQINDKK